MIAIKIDVVRRTVAIIAMGNTLLDFYRHIDCNVMEAVYPRGLDPRDRLYVDEEGLLHGINHFFTIEGYPQQLAGNGLIVGHNEEGESVDAHTALEVVLPKIKFLGRKMVVPK